jgi:zinc protease
MLSEQNRANQRLANLELQREVFGNGFVVLSNEARTSDTVAISGSLKAGAICDEPGSFGTAELVSRLLMRGTEMLSAGQISQKIEESGATLSFDNRDESVGFSSRCYSGVLHDILKIIGDCLMNPSFPDHEIDLARNEIISDIKAEEDDTRSVASRALSEIVFGRNAPYGRDSLGRIDDLKAITQKDLKLFHEKNYSPDRLIIAITGGYDFEETAKPEIEKVFSGWTGAAGKLHYDEPQTRSNGGAGFGMKHKTQVDIALGTRAIPRSSHDYYAMNLGNLILGRLGLYGRLGEKVREENGLAYYSYSVLQSRLFTGLFGAFAGVNPSNTLKARDAMLEEIRKITVEPIPQKELETAKRNSLGSLSISLDTSVERVAILHDIEYNGLGLDYLERIPAILDRVSSEQILDSFERHVDPEKLATVFAGPVPEGLLKLPSAGSSL